MYGSSGAKLGGECNDLGTSSMSIGAATMSGGMYPGVARAPLCWPRHGWPQ